MQRPWHSVLIEDCGESLRPLQSFVTCMEPHPYLNLGAPYGEGANPFCLRQCVRSRLLAAQLHLNALTTRHGCQPLRLAIFDAWRPLPVQAFMVDYAIEQECVRQGINPEASDQRDCLERVRAEVSCFWAPPCSDLATPPPHSTGAAVDLTLMDAKGCRLEMGGEIDAIGPESLPNHHADAGSENPGGKAALFHSRRCLLHRVMRQAGFIRHPNEWWHFSFGDQLWAWTVNADHAIYGRDQRLFNLKP